MSRKKTITSRDFSPNSEPGQTKVMQNKGRQSKTGRSTASDLSEFAIFIHAHMQGYDATGKGISRDTSFYDRYGAPYYEGDGSMPPPEEQEGWDFIESRISEYNANITSDPALDFPTVSGYAGGAHLYSQYHSLAPWNWTGWIPEGDTGAGVDRILPALRGNEIQNNFWDYDPYDPTAGTGSYPGGYWYQGQAFARYLHINSLIAMGTAERFNSIVHPLYYPRFTQDPDHPNNTTDGMQKAINDIHTEAKINSSEWGGGCDGLEIFNDFSYYYSYVNPNGTVVTVGNGDLDFAGSDGSQVYNWVDTYPLEFGAFLLDNALSNGTYLYAVAGNDSYYDKNEEPPEDGRDIKLDPAGNPYGNETVFGYTLLLLESGAIIPGETPINQDESKIMFALKSGMYVSSTGLYNLLDLSDGSLPYTVSGQNHDQLVTSMTPDMELIFEFPKATEAGARVLWMYHLEGYPPEGNDNVDNLVGQRYLQRTTGYFKLRSDFGTRLDLGSSWDKDKLKWIRFEAIDPDNPQKRAWFNPIRGLNFGG